MYREQNHFILKLGVGLIVLFLAIIAFKDFTPNETQITKTVVYGQK